MVTSTNKHTEPRDSLQTSDTLSNCPSGSVIYLKISAMQVTGPARICARLYVTSTPSSDYSPILIFLCNTCIIPVHYLLYTLRLPPNMRSVLRILLQVLHQGEGRRMKACSR